MATNKLKIYNGALIDIGERTLSSLTESREPRRVLDDVWDHDFVDEILQKGQWNFAARTVLIDYDADVTPPFGYTRAFSKPSDWLRTMGLAEDEKLSLPLRHYEDEAGFWYADPDSIYVKYVSNGYDYGNNLSKWPSNFRRFAELYLASRICTRITQNESKTEKIIKMADDALKKAKSTDAMDEAVGTMPSGRWSMARHGRSFDRERRGS